MGQQKYSLPKIKIIIGHPKTSSKQILMVFVRPSEKERVFTCVLGAQKNSLGETFFERPKHNVWLDYNITMMSDTCVVGTQRNSLCETLFESPKHMFGSIKISR